MTEFDPPNIDAHVECRREVDRLNAQVAELTRERDEARGGRDEHRDRAEAAHNLHANVERLLANAEKLHRLEYARIAELEAQQAAVLALCEDALRPCKFVHTGVCTHGEGALDPALIRAIYAQHPTDVAASSPRSNEPEQQAFDASVKDAEQAVMQAAKAWRGLVREHGTVYALGTRAAVLIATLDALAAIEFEAEHRASWCCDQCRRLSAASVEPSVEQTDGPGHGPLPDAVEGCTCSHTIYTDLPGQPVQRNPDTECPAHGRLEASASS